MIIETYTTECLDEHNIRLSSRDKEIKGITMQEKVMELFYLDQLGYRISKHHDTNDEHARSIEHYMKIFSVAF